MSESAMLDKCRDLAIVRLSEDLAQTLARVVGDLTALTHNDPSPEMHSLFTNSLELARDKNILIAAAFKRRFLTRFNEGKRPLRTDTSAPELNLTRSKLSEPDDLENFLAANSLASAITTLCPEELSALSKRVGTLLKTPNLQTEQLPLSPDVIGESLLNALKDQNASTKIKLMLVLHINKYYPVKVCNTYQEVNRFLIAQKILPPLDADTALPTVSLAAAPVKATPVKAAVPKPLPSRPPLASTAPILIPPEASRQDILLMFQQWMAYDFGGSPLIIPGWSRPPTVPDRMQAGETSPGSNANAATLQILTQIQQGNLEGFSLGNLSAAHIYSGRINVLRELRNLRTTGLLVQSEVMTLDIVMRLFDFILEDKRVPDAIKALIGRLQIPILKVSLLDTAFYSQKTHSARRLLDLFAESSVGWEPAEGRNSNLYQKINQIVQYIVKNFDDNLNVFNDVLNEYEVYLANEKQASDTLTTRSAQFLRNREQTEIAQLVAHDAILASLRNKNNLAQTPAPIRDFLLKHWKERLIQLHVEYSENSREWQEGVSTMNDLLWSLSPKTDKDERRKLIELLPRLLKHLDSGINALNIDRAVRDVFFSDLVRCHAVAVKAGFHESADPVEAVNEPIPEISTPTSTEPRPLDFEEIPLMPEDVIPDAALLEEIAAAQEASSDIEEITIGGVRGETWDEPRNSHYENMVRDLKRGVWIEFKQENDTSLRAKLAWISPLQNTYLLTNRHGQRAISINVQGLAIKFRESRAQIIDGMPLIERAINNVFEYFLRGA